MIEQSFFYNVEYLTKSFPSLSFFSFRILENGVADIYLKSENI